MGLTDLRDYYRVSINCVDKSLFCFAFTNMFLSDFPFVYLTIIPRARVGYEMIDSQRGA